MTAARSTWPSHGRQEYSGSQRAGFAQDFSGGESPLVTADVRACPDWRNRGCERAPCLPPIASFGDCGVRLQPCRWRSPLGASHPMNTPKRLAFRHHREAYMRPHVDGVHWRGCRVSLLSDLCQDGLLPRRRVALEESGADRRLAVVWVGWGCFDPCVADPLAVLSVRGGSTSSATTLPQARFRLKDAPDSTP